MPEQVFQISRQLSAKQRFRDPGSSHIVALPSSTFVFQVPYVPLHQPGGGGSGERAWQEGFRARPGSTEHDMCSHSMG